MYKYKFSVIMCMYKAEKYLRTAIDSIINQDIGFEKNIQLILVNDGSPDKCGAICCEYKNRYPNNITYIEKENGGLASAKNVGLKFIKGEYINFFDSDDILPKNTFSEVYKFFQENELCVDIVTIPLVFFGSKKGLHPKYKYMGDKNRVIDLNKEPYNFILSNAASFYKNSIIKGMHFDETYFGEEDTLINGLLYLKNSKIGYVCEKGVKYNYRKNDDQSSLVSMAKEKPQSYKTVVKLLDQIIDKKNIKEYQKELIIYELKSRYKKIKPDIFDSIEEYRSVLREYKRLVKLIDANYIIKCSKYCETAKFKKFLLDIISDKNSKEDEIKVNNNLQTATIRFVKIDNNFMYLDVSYTKVSNENLKIYISDEKKNVYSSYDEKRFDGPFNVEIGKFMVDKSNVAKFKIDIDKIRKIKFILKDEKTNEYYSFKDIKMNKVLNFSAFVKKIRFGNYLIYYRNKEINIEKKKNNFINRFKEKIYCILSILIKQHYFAFERLFNVQNKKYILINDRSTKGGDNGEALFKYIIKNEPKMAKKTYFVVKKSSIDYKRIKKYGKVVAHGSLKHKILFLNAKWIYSSHMMYEFYNPFENSKYLYYIDLVRSKFVWLQHGITMNDISSAANKYNKKNDYIVSCTNAEYAEFSKDKYSYDKDDIILAGFARYDLLDNNPQNIISIAPTWRRGFGESSINKSNSKQEIISLFSESEYYKKYKEILTSKKLLDVCRKKGIVVHFALHPEMINYIEKFDIFKNDIVKLIRPEDLVYKDMFEKSKLLVTDYSSVVFDFSYLKKPIIYYQFDEEKFFSGHYKRGYFDYRKDGFGPVVCKSNEIIDKIIYYINNDFKIEAKYLKRINKTYKFHDKDNSKRIIENTYKKEL